MDNPFEMLQASIEKMEARFMERLNEVLPIGPVQSILSVGDEKLLTVNEVASHLKCQPSTVRKYARNNKIPFHRASKVYMFKISEVDQALSSLSVPKKNRRN